jgi:2-keto-4-pentenoate hydratase
MSTNAIKAAEALMSAHSCGVKFHSIASDFAITTTDNAYEVQREYVGLQMQARGTAAAGYKVGLTSKRMQEMCGIDNPIAGVVLNDRIMRSGAKISASDYARPGLEFEIAMRLGRDLRSDGRVLQLTEVGDAIDAVCPAIEIIDDRHADYGSLDVLSVIADNSWNEGIVLGTFQRPPVNLDSVEGVVSQDGAVIDRGWGRDVLDHPFHSVAWLAAHLAATGSVLRAGDVVMTGSLVTTKFPQRSSSYRFELVGLGVVELAVDI